MSKLIPHLSSIQVEVENDGMARMAVGGGAQNIELLNINLNPS